MNWVVLALVSALMFAIVNILDKFVLSNEEKDPLVAVVISGLVATIFFSFISIFLGKTSFEPKFIVLGLLSGILYSLGNVVYYHAMSKVQVSKFVPLLTIRPLFVLVIAVLFLGEVASFINYIGIFLMVLGVFFTAGRKNLKEFKLQSVLFLAVASAFIFAIRDIAIKYVSLLIDLSSFLIWVGLGSGLIALLVFVVHHPIIRKKIEEEGIKHLTLINAMGVLGIFFFFLALSNGPVTLVVALVQIKPLFVLFLTSILSVYDPKKLHETMNRSSLFQKLISVAFMVTGAILIVL